MAWRRIARPFFIRAWKEKKDSKIGTVFPDRTCYTVLRQSKEIIFIISITVLKEAAVVQKGCGVVRGLGVVQLGLGFVFEIGCAGLTEQRRLWG